MGMGRKKRGKPLNLKKIRTPDSKETGGNP